MLMHFSSSECARIVGTTVSESAVKVTEDVLAHAVRKLRTMSQTSKSPPGSQPLLAVHMVHLANLAKEELAAASTQGWLVAPTLVAPHFPWEGLAPIYIHRGWPRTRGMPDDTGRLSSTLRPATVSTLRSCRTERVCGNKLAPGVLQIMGLRQKAGDLAHSLRIGLPG